MTIKNSTKKTRLPALLLAVVPSASDPNKSYEIKQSQNDGVIYCSCPSWIFDQEGKKLVGYARPSKERSCKHIRAYTAGHLTPPTVKVVKAPAQAPVSPAAPKEVNVSTLRKTAEYALKHGQDSAKVLTLLKEGGLSDLAAWSLLAEIDQ